MADYPSIPFQNSLSGPAGEYSDAYKKIVQQYRDDVESGQALRAFQQDQMYVDAGLRPPSATLQALRPPRPQYLKSGQDWYQVGMNGKPQLIVDAPEVSHTPPRLISPAEVSGLNIPQGWQAVPTYGTRGFTVEREPRQDLFSQLGITFGGSSTNQPPAPPLNPAPGLTIPQTATASAPAYTPAPMMAPDEVAPPGSIVIGRKNALAAPPSTTQNPTRVLDADTAKQILAKVNGDKAKARELAVKLGYSLK